MKSSVFPSSAFAPFAALFLFALTAVPVGAQESVPPVPALPAGGPAGIPSTSQADGSLPPPAEAEPLVFADAPGSYAIYRDTRFGRTAYIGLCALGGNELALRLYVPATATKAAEEALVLQTFYVSGGEDPSVEPGTLKIIRGDFSPKASAGAFLPMVYGWINAWLHSRGDFEDMPEYTWDEDGRYDFQYWIPVLQMRGADLRSPVGGGEDGEEGDGDSVVHRSVDSASPDGAGRGEVVLVTAGVAESETDPAFFAYAGEPEILAGPETALERGDAMIVTLDGLSAALDANWKGEADGSYTLPGSTGQDAYFMVETLNMDEFGDGDTFDLIRLFILHSGGMLLPDSLRIFVFNENPCLFFRVYDPSTKLVTVQYRLFIPRDQTRLSVVSLGAFESVYGANRAYFDGILF